MVLSEGRARLAALLGVLALLATASPALAYDAKNADNVDGKHAVSSTSTASKRRNKLVAAGRTGFLPNNIIKMAPNSSKLGGKSLAQVIASATDVYTAGAGLGVEANQFSLLDAFRLPQGCSADDVVQFDAPGWGCVALPDGVSYTAGAGLDLSVGNEFSVDTSVIQSRVSGSCVAGQSIRVIAADGSVTCDPDNDTTYTAGAGLSLAGNSFSVNFSGNGVANSAARSDHNHDATYWNQGGSTGTTPGADYIGTSDNQALELKVNATRALRLEPNATSPNLLGGFAGNTLTPTVHGAVIAGGGASLSENRVSDIFGTIGGGTGNFAGDNAGTTTDRGAATVAGGSSNFARGQASTVGGGFLNEANGQYATVAGGSSNVANTTRDAVGGGSGNQAVGGFSTVGGGANNEVSGNSSTIPGGASNIVSGTSSVVGGGQNNLASGNVATVAGGVSNTAGQTWATVGGGSSNTAGASYATVPGGNDNDAVGPASFAAGTKARANHAGAFVWGDSTFADVASPGSNTFSVRAAGGVWFGATSTPAIPAGQFIATSTGAHLTTGGAWTNSSDRNLKSGFRSVDGIATLETLSQMPISTWYYDAEGRKVRHIGPTAQAFRAAFALGSDDKAIATVDADGVALSAIQGLYELVQDQQAQIDRLERLVLRRGGMNSLR